MDLQEGEESKEPQDNQTLISKHTLRNFSRAGYLTLCTEDAPKIAIFVFQTLNMRERKRERQRQTQTETETKRERETERERERERERDRDRDRETERDTERERLRERETNPFSSQPTRSVVLRRPCAVDEILKSNY